MGLLSKKIRTLIIDDSALVREILSRGLAMDPSIEVVGAASDVYIGRDMIVRLRPDVLTLDIEMPKMDGLEFLSKLMPQYPLPVVVVSSLTQKGKETTIKALELGAVDFIPKPSSNIARSLDNMILELRTKIKIASMANVSFWKSKRVEHLEASKYSSKGLTETTDKIIAIGASTGGTEAIKRVIDSLPRNLPGILITQHMPSGFTKAFADRLNQSALLEVKEAEDNEKIISGRAYIAPGDFHLRAVRRGGYYYAQLDKEEKMNGHRPSVDALFKSVAETAAKNAIGIILTGMGADGAKGLKEMRDSGAYTIGQDEKTCVVYGMPKAAFDLGAVIEQAPIENISKAILKSYENIKTN